MHTSVLREAATRQPFEPFTLRMNDGREFYVAHPEYILVSRRYIVVADHETETPIWVEPVLIASMHPGRPARGNGKKRQR